MSVLLHLCRSCLHKATSHDGGDKGYSGCTCCRGAGDIDPRPVLVETFTSPGGRREGLYEPGSTWNAGTTHQIKLCACTACQDTSRTHPRPVELPEPRDHAP